MGVTDIVSKDSLSRLPLVVERTLSEQKVNREKKAAEHEFILNEERLELALEGTDLGIWDLDFTSSAIVFNSKSLDILGLKLENAIQDFRLFQKIIKRSDESAILEMNDHILGKTPFFDREFPVKNSSGELKWVLARGKIIRKYLNAESVAHVSSYEWSASGNAFVYSAEFRRIFEMQDDEQVSVFQLIKRAMHKQDLPYFKEMLSSGKDFFDIEHRIVLPNDVIKIVRNTGNIKFGNKGKIWTVTGVVQDITE